MAPGEPTDKLEHTAPSAGAGHVALLFSFAGELRVHALRREGDSCVLGRAEPAEITFDDGALSRVHARFSLGGGSVLLEDLRSTNGCLVNGERVASGQLSEGDVARLGGVEVRIYACGVLPTHHAAVSHQVLLARLEEEVTRARLYGRRLAVVAIKHDDERSLRDGLPLLLRPLDRMCCFAPTLTWVLLAEMDELAVRGWCERLSSQCGRRVQIAIANYPGLALPAPALVARALDLCHQLEPGSVRAAGDEVSAVTDDANPVVMSPAMLKLYELVARAARTAFPVLIQGETGSGKELVARALHELGPREKAPFKALNCGAIPAQLVEGLLFGHERGAYTGADRQTPGLFEQAQGGTLFLDEIGELPSAPQAALLRVLEQRSVVRLGGAREIPVDVRVVAATHRDLRAMVQARTFREDLLFRLDALTLYVPPLRARREEIATLALRFLSRARTQWDACAERFSPQAMEALEAYAFPGNVRELKNAVERAAVVCAGAEIQLEDLPPQLWASDADAPSTPAPEPVGALQRRLRDVEIDAIRDALERARGNQSAAARMLGVPRRTLAHKAHVYGLVRSSSSAVSDR